MHSLCIPRLSKLPILTLTLFTYWNSTVQAQDTPESTGTTSTTSEATNAPKGGQSGGKVQVVLPAVTVFGASEPLRGGLPPVYAGGQIARGGSLGILGNVDFMDAPFSVTSYTAQVMQDQQARSINDVVKNDASVRTLWANSSYNSQFSIRGFPVSGQDIAVNGVYGIVPPQLTNSLGMFERVEVLHGPSAMLNGMAPFGAVGGTINLVTKRATDIPTTQATVSYMSKSQLGTSVDVGRRLGDEHQLGIRFNGSYQNGDTSVDGQQQRVGSAALGLDYRSDRVRLSADVGYQNFKVDDPSRPIYTGNGNFAIPSAPKGSLNPGQSWYYAKSEDIFGMVHGEVDITPNLTAYLTAGGRHNRFLGLYNFIFLQNEKGDFQARQYYQPNYSDTWTLLGGLTGKVTTGPVTHTLNLSASTLDIESGNLVQTPQPSPYSGNLYDPAPIPRSSLTGFTSSAPRTAHSVLNSVALADAMSMFDGRV